MVIIFEGHDKSGKSTIAAALSRQLGVPMFKVKRDKYWWDPMVNLLYLTEGITQFMEQTLHPVILDRWHPSDYVYSKLFNRDISQRKINELDDRMAKLDTLIVFCFKDKASYIEDLEDKDFVNIDLYDRMTEYYMEYSRQTKCRTLWINTSSQKLQEQLDLIKENI